MQISEIKDSVPARMNTVRSAVLLQAAKLESQQSFDVLFEVGENPVSKHKSIVSAVSSFGRKVDRKFGVCKIDGGVSVWRKA